MSHHKIENSRPTLERWPTALPAELIGPALAQVEIAFNHGNIEEAHAAVDRVFEAIAAPPVQVTLESPLIELGLPVRVVNELEEAGVLTVRGLCEESIWSLGNIRNFGPLKVQEVVDAVERHGYRLREPMRAVQSA
jgi:DNA-directed RNA polymerase alpha subunit